ncbi:AIR synthase family protein [bacterium]|nr:AIR synthase family protein [candidate division CSSED10-310 bacterium]
MKSFPPGKIPYECLEKIISSTRVDDPRVIIGPRPGEDAAVVDFDKKLLIAKSDPITMVEENLGWYLVNINANDIAVMGGEPRWLLVTSLLPELGTDQAMVERLHGEVISACKELGINLIGGHTEVTQGLDRPILVGHMLGEATYKTLVDKRKIRSGDLILLTKGIAIEGTAMIARMKEEELTRELTDQLIKRAVNFIYEPGLSIVKDAKLAVKYGGIHGMHDPTEGGLLGGVFELMNGLDMGVELYESKIPVFPETVELCRYFGLDPLRLIASGALLVVAPAEQMVGLQHRYKQEGIESAIIGKVVESHEQIRIKRLTGWDYIHPDEGDEIAKIL